MGIPYLHKLRFQEPKLSEISLVWPFESGFTSDPLADTNAQILYTEIWPSLVERPKKDKIPDREQVRTYLSWLRIQQAASTLGNYFDTPTGLTKKDIKACINEEGWVLGA